MTVSDDTSIVDRLIETRGIKIITEFLHSMVEETVKFTLFGFSNIGAGSTAQAETILRDKALMIRILTLLGHISRIISNETTWVIIQALNTASYHERRVFHCRYSRDYITKLVESLTNFKKMEVDLILALLKKPGQVA